jgi:hypothetical protein
VHSPWHIDEVEEFSHVRLGGIASSQAREIEAGLNQLQIAVESIAVCEM